MSDYISRQAAIEAIRASTSKYTGLMEMEMYTDDDAVEAINCVPSAQPTADVRDDATAHKLVGGGEHDGATCWFECDNCGLAVDIGDVFCKHCGARFVP